MVVLGGGVPAVKTDLIARIKDLVGDGGLRLSVIAIRDGAGVLDRVLGSGEFRRVLEIGTLRGISAAYIAQFVEHVDTIDLVHGRLEQLGVAFDREKFWRDLGADNISLHLVRDDAEKAATIGRLEFDLAFIDGGKNDIASDFALVKHCGAVLFHDVDRRGVPGQDAVYDFVMALPKDEVVVMDIFALWRAPRG